jgi:diguanylate cyclase (GGDEF)-like protein/PAS domain S-box-containing protein
MNNDFYKNILFQSPIGYAYHEIILDPNGKPRDYRFIEVNSAFESFTGLLSKHILGKTVLEVLPNIVDDKFDWIANYGDIALHNTKKVFESYSAPLKKWYEIEAFSPKKGFFVTVFRDVSRKIEKEEELLKSETIFKNAIQKAPIPIMIHSSDGKVLNLSQTWENLSGYKHDDIATIDKWTKAAYGTKHSDVKAFINKFYKLNKVQHDGQFLVNTKNKNKLLWDFYSTYIGNTADNHKIAMSVAFDVTKDKEIQELLTKERLRFEATLLSVGDGVICTNKHGEITLINKIAEQLTGWKKEDALGKNVEEVFAIYSELTGIASENIIKKVIEKGTIHELTNHTVLKSKDGIVRPIADSAAPIILSNGDIIGAVLVFRDYTEKYRSQQKIEDLVEELRHTQVLLKASLNSPLDIIMLSLDKNYNYLLFNDAHRKSMKAAYNAEVKIGDHLFDYMTSKEDIKKAKLNYGKALSGISHTTLEEFGDVEVHTFETMYSPIRDENDNIIGATAYARDVSDRIRALNQIKESEEKYRLILNSTTDGMYGVDIHNRCIFVNQSFLDLLGYEKEDEFIGKNIHNLIHHHADGTIYLEEVCDVEHAILLGEKGKVGESVLWKKDGSKLEVEFTANPQFKDDKLIGAVVTFRDITQRLINRKLLENEKELAQEYLNIAGVMIVVLDENGEVTLINKKGCEIIGKNEEDIIGKNWFDNFVPQDEIEIVKQVFKSVFINNSNLASKYENSIINDKGEERIISWYNEVLKNSDGEIIGVLSSGEDVTEMKNAVNKLQENEKRFRNLFEQAPFGYQSLDNEGCFLAVNQKWLDIFGYKKEEVIGKWFGDFLVPQFKNLFKSNFERFKHDGSIHSEFMMLTKEGKHIQVGFDGNIAYNEHHEFEQTHCTVSDVTEINIANNKLKESELRYRKLIDNLDSGIVVHAIDTSVISFNKRAEEILGLNYNELNGQKSASDKFHFIDTKYEKLENSLYPINIILETKASLKDYILGIKHNHDDKTVWVSANGVPIFNDDQSIREVVISFTDISHEKEKQDEVTYLSNHDYLTGLYNRRFFTESYHRLNHKAHYPLGIMMIDVNGLKIINDAYGHNVGDIVLKNVSEILQKSSRDEDVVCRVGGDEFAIILPSIKKNELDDIKQTIKNNAKNIKVRNVSLSLAIGFEIKNEIIDDSLDKILKSAENNMYRHKLTEGVSMRNHAIKAILRTLTDKYEEERIHSKKVSQLCEKMGEVLNLKEEDIKELEQAGMYHDIGKISIPDAILNKPGRLTKEEFEVIKTHPEISYQILRAADEYSDLAIHALHHHERWDGKGYPSGKKGLEIPMFSRIICIIDAYEAMTAVRVYKDKMSQEEAVKEIIRCSGTQFDERLAKIFIEKVLKKEWIELT